MNDEPAPIGHNTSGDQLKSVVDRIEALESDRAAIASDIRDIYAEAKSSGFDGKTLRTIIRLRKQTPEDRKAQEEILATYMAALGMLD